MHELSIAMSIIDVVQEAAQERGAVQVKAVYLKVGALAGVVPDALRTSYHIAAFETPLEGSELIVNESPVLMNCPLCQARRPVQSVQMLYCAVCGTPAMEIVQGRELVVVGMEVVT